jgi:hypothetical protein
VLSTVDSAEGIVSLSIPECLADQTDQLVQALKLEIALSEIDFPGAGSVQPPRSCRNA